MPFKADAPTADEVSMRLSRRSSAVPTGDDGFSLVEAIVSLAIATAIFTALAFALVGGTKAGLLSQQNQQAGDVLNQAVEDARALSYGQLAMRQTDLDTGEVGRMPAISAGYYNPTSDSTAEDTSTAAVELETLAPRDANGLISPHVTTVAQNGRNFTVRRYVTIPNDAAGAVYKRLTVVVTWDGLGKERKRIYSTLVADTRRGLPLPDFKFVNSAGLSQCRNPASSLTYAFKLQNNGARDAWSLTPTTASPGWTYYADTNANGSFDSTVDQPLPSATGTVSTGLIEPTAAVDFFAVTTTATALAQPVPYVMTTVFRATSVAQPAYWQELTATTTVQAGPCGAVAPTPTASPSATAAPSAPPQPAPSCASLTGTVAASAPGGTNVRYYPMNPSQPGDTLAATDMPLQRDAGTTPAAGSLYNYSTDLHSAAGRKLASGTSTSSAASQVASWTYSMPSNSVVKGSGQVTFYATMADGSTTARPAFEVYLDRLNADGSLAGSLGSASYTTPAAGWGCAGYRPVSLSIVNVSGNGLELPANSKLRLRVVMSSADPVLLAYGTADYPMSLTIPYKDGLG